MTMLVDDLMKAWIKHVVDSTGTYMEPNFIYYDEEGQIGYVGYEVTENSEPIQINEEQVRYIAVSYDMDDIISYKTNIH